MHEISVPQLMLSRETNAAHRPLRARGSVPAIFTCTWLAAATIGACFAWAATHHAKAATVYEFQPPVGAFALLSPEEQHGHPPKLYGANSPAATWGIAQWDIPERLPPFQAGRSQGRFGSVHVTPDGGHELRQTTKDLPCDKVFGSGRRLPDEFDLFARPLHPIAPTRESAGMGKAQPSLAVALDIKYRIDVQIDELRILDNACQQTMANVLAAVVLSNPTAKQTLFYQIYLGRFKSDGRVLADNYVQPWWFWTGQNAQSGGGGSFGYDDNIRAGYGLEQVAPGKKLHVNINLLPRLRAIIAQGKRYGLDQDLSHWWISGTYHGQNAFGHVIAASRWSGFSLTVTTLP